MALSLTFRTETPTVPVEVDGVAYDARVDIAASARVRQLGEALRGAESLAGADAEEVLAFDAEAGALARSALAAVFGEDGAARLCGDGPLGLAGATSACRLLTELLTSPEYLAAVRGEVDAQTATADAE